MHSGKSADAISIGLGKCWYSTFKLGWYLMVPPTDNKSVYVGAPLSEWKHLGSYDSGSYCEEVRRGLIQIQKENPAYAASECVDATNPRLRRR